MSARDVSYEIRPFEGGRWSDPETPKGQRKNAGTFRASWSDTLVLLRDEIDKVGGKLVIVQIDLQDGDLRRDGMIKANARVGHRGVVVSFDSKHGPLRYACDTYEGRWAGDLEGWQANTRAIALTLQALRAVDRYGAASRAQQYQGWQALPPGRGDAPSAMTANEAIEIIRRHGPASSAIASASIEWTTDRLIKFARVKTHPDRNGGERTAWDEVEQAARVLGVAS